MKRVFFGIAVLIVALWITQHSKEGFRSSSSHGGRGAYYGAAQGHSRHPVSYDSYGWRTIGSGGGSSWGWPWWWPWYEETVIII